MPNRHISPLYNIPYNYQLFTNTHAGKHARTHAHTFNGPLSGTTRVSRYQKGKTNLDFTEARDSEWQWHQLGMCKSAHRSRQITTPAPQHSVFLQAGCPSCRPTNSVKALKAQLFTNLERKWPWEQKLRLTALCNKRHTWRKPKKHTSNVRRCSASDSKRFVWWSFPPTTSRCSKDSLSAHFSCWLWTTWNDFECFRELTTASFCDSLRNLINKSTTKVSYQQQQTCKHSDKNTRIFSICLMT